MAYSYDIPFHVELTGRVALVTGGSGGIGGMFCRALAACGATVIVLGRSMERCMALVDEINAGGGDAYAMAADVTDEAQLLCVKQRIAEQFGGLDILINAAGGAVKGAMGPHDQLADGGETTFFDVENAEIEKEINLNLRGTWLPCKLLTPLMVGRPGANVLNISSMGAFHALTRIPGYSAAKSGVSNFTQWLAVYLAKSGIRVNAMAPGFFSTAQNRALQFNPDGSPKPRMEKILRETPMGRVGRLEELIGGMLFLVGEKSAGFVTGIVLPIDGGFSAFGGV